MGDAAEQLRRRREARRNKILHGEGQRLAKIVGSNPEALPPPHVQGVAEEGEHAVPEAAGYRDIDIPAHTPTLLTLHKPASTYAEGTDTLGTAPQRASPPTANKPTPAFNVSLGWPLLLGLLAAYYGRTEAGAGDNVLTGLSSAEIAYDAPDSTPAVVCVLDACCACDVSAHKFAETLMVVSDMSHTSSIMCAQ